MNKIHFKVRCNNEFRRFDIDKSELNYTKFLQQVKDLFGLKEIPNKIQYKDEEGDFVTCESNSEFEGAITQTPKDAVIYIQIGQPAPKSLGWKRHHSRSWCGEASIMKSGENVVPKQSEEEKKLSSEQTTEEFHKFGRFHGWRRRRAFWMNLSKDEREKFKEKFRKMKEGRHEKFLKKQERMLAWKSEREKRKQHCKKMKLEVNDATASLKKLSV